MFNAVNFAYLEDLLQFCQKKSLLHAVGKWPVLQEAFEKCDRQNAVLSQEEHRATKKLLVELGAGLHFMKRDDNILEEYNMLIAERYSEATDDASEDVKQFSSTVKLMCLVNQGIEGFIDRLSDHLSTRNQLCVELVQDIFEIISFDRFLRIKKLEEFLHKLWCHVNFE